MSIHETPIGGHFCTECGAGFSYEPGRFGMCVSCERLYNREYGELFIDLLDALKAATPPGMDVAIGGPTTVHPDDVHPWTPPRRGAPGR